MSRKIDANEKRMDAARAIPHPPPVLDEEAQARLRAAREALGIPVERGTHSLDADVRRALGRLDAGRATPAQAQSALASAGIHVSITTAGEWLDGRLRRGGR